MSTKIGTVAFPSMIDGLGIRVARLGNVRIYDEQRYHCVGIRPYSRRESVGPSAARLSYQHALVRALATALPGPLALAET